jgi:hypothetical protein
MRGLRLLLFTKVYAFPAGLIASRVPPGNYRRYLSILSKPFLWIASSLPSPLHFSYPLSPPHPAVQFTQCFAFVISPSRWLSSASLSAPRPSTLNHKRPARLHSAAPPLPPPAPRPASLSLTPSPLPTPSCSSISKPVSLPTSPAAEVPPSPPGSPTTASSSAINKPPSSARPPSPPVPPGPRLNISSPGSPMAPAWTPLTPLASPGGVTRDTPKITKVIPW